MPLELGIVILVAVIGQVIYFAVGFGRLTQKVDSLCKMVDETKKASESHGRWLTKVESRLSVLEAAGNPRTGNPRRGAKNG